MRKGRLCVRIFRFCTVLYGGFIGYEIACAGSFDVCAVRREFTLFLLYPNLYPDSRYCLLYCCSVVSMYPQSLFVGVPFLVTVTPSRCLHMIHRATAALQRKVLA